MGRMVPIGQEEQGAGTVPVFRTTVTAPMPNDISIEWKLILIGLVVLAVILRSE